MAMTLTAFCGGGIQKPVLRDTGDCLIPPSKHHMNASNSSRQLPLLNPSRCQPLARNASPGALRPSRLLVGAGWRRRLLPRHNAQLGAHRQDVEQRGLQRLAPLRKCIVSSRHVLHGQMGRMYQGSVTVTPMVTVELAYSFAHVAPSRACPAQRSANEPGMLAELLQCCAACRATNHALIRARCLHSWTCVK